MGSERNRVPEPSGCLMNVTVRRASGTPMTAAKDRIYAFFNNLRRDALHLVDEFYDENVEFIDPLGSHDGVAAVRKYYAGLYENVTAIRFEFGPMIEEGDTVSAPWQMHLSARTLNGGRPIGVPGISYIRFNLSTGKAIYHRDYFDMGAFIYEHVPVLGSVVRMVNRRLRA